jgi:branched-chain amino acid transport system permease protein
MTHFGVLALGGVSNGAVYAIVALALVMIWRATRIVNFAQGGMLMLTTFIAWDLEQVHNVNYWLTLVITLAIGLVFGALVERLLIRPVESGPALNPVIVTLGLLVLLEAVAGMIWGSTQQRSYAPGFSIRSYRAGHTALDFAPNDLYIVIAVLAVVLGLFLLFQRTPIGLRLRASAFNPEVARLLGVRVGRMLTLGWALAAAIGALAGLLIAGTQPGYVTPNGFDGLLVYGFTAAVIGGLDSPAGAVVGGVGLGVVLSWLDDYVSSDIETMYVFLLLIVVLMIRPNGLFARSRVRRV